MPTRHNKRKDPLDGIQGASERQTRERDSLDLHRVLAFGLNEALCVHGFRLSMALCQVQEVLKLSGVICSRPDPQLLHHQLSIQIKRDISKGFQHNLLPNFKSAV